MFPRLLYLWFDSYDNLLPRVQRWEQRLEEVNSSLTRAENSSFSEIQKVDNGRFCFLHDYLCDSSVIPHQIQYIQAPFALTGVSMAPDTGLSSASDLRVW
jgi:hypothetical protein